MTKGAIVCAACGAKVSAARTRCPRCRAVLTSAPAAADPNLSARTVKIAGGVLAVVVVVAAIILWRSGEAPPAAIRQPTAAGPSAPAAARGPIGVKDPAEAPQPPPFEIAPGLTPVPESADDARGARNVSSRSRTQSPGSGDPLQHRPRVPAPRPAARGGCTAEAGTRAEGRTTGRTRSARVTRFALSEQFSEAVAAFRTARALMPGDAATSYNLALALQRLGNYPAAAEEYAAAPRAQRSSPLAEARTGHFAGPSGKDRRGDRSLRRVPAADACGPGRR